MGLTVIGCCPKKPLIIESTVVPSCPPVMLVVPTIPVRPSIMIRYKIEEKKEWFAMDRDAYISLRDYIIMMEGALGFATQEIKESNKVQSGGQGSVP